MDRPRFWLRLGGVALFALGVVFLLDAVGLALVSVRDVVMGAAAVLLMVMGVRLLHRSRRTRREPFVDLLIGSVRRGSEWEVTSHEFIVGIGQVHLDLGLARVPPGEHRLWVDCLVGSIRVVLPGDTGVAVDCRVTLGEIVAFGRRLEGVSRRFTFRSPDYDRRERRIFLEATATIGQVSVSLVREAALPSGVPVSSASL
jgi:hypothetical protein